jgi:hypothetical protein
MRQPYRLLEVGRGAWDANGTRGWAVTVNGSSIVAYTDTEKEAIAIKGMLTSAPELFSALMEAERTLSRIYADRTDDPPAVLSVVREALAKAAGSKP